MEVWFLIGGILAFGILDAMHPDPEFFSRTYDVSADEIRKALDIYKTSGITTYLPTGEVEVLGPGMINFGEEMNEAERLLKEAKEKQV